MKTFLKIIAKTIVKVSLLSVLLIAFACSSGNRENSDASVKLAVTQAKQEPPKMDLHAAVIMGNVAAVRQHIAAGSDLNVKEPTVGSSPLISAAVFNKVEIAKLLVEGGADVNLTNNEQSTALHSAAFLCRKEIVQLLLDNDADKSLVNMHGSTPLQSVQAPFEYVKPIYEIFNKDLGPLGFKVEYDYLEKTRPEIASMLQ